MSQMDYAAASRCPPRAFDLHAKQFRSLVAKTKAEASFPASTSGEATDKATCVSYPRGVHDGWAWKEKYLFSFRGFQCRVWYYTAHMQSALGETERILHRVL